MDPNGFEKAKGHYNDAVAALEAIGRASFQVDTQKAWKAFLLSANGVYDILKTSAQGKTASENWFARKVGERRKDPLLSYLHAARNCEEHGIVGGLQFSPHLFPALEEDGVIEQITAKDGVPIEAVFRGVSGKKRVLRPSLPVPFLTKVTDSRFNTEFQPAKTHLGKPINGEDPMQVAPAALAYLRSMLAEAEGLIQGPLRETHPSQFPSWVLQKTET